MFCRGHGTSTGRRNQTTMKVLNLQCSHHHAFEGWFGSEEEFQEQLSRGLVECPLGGDVAAAKMPSAPRLNFGASEPKAKRDVMTTPDTTMQAEWLKLVRHVMTHT